VRRRRDSKRSDERELEEASLKGGRDKGRELEGGRSSSSGKLGSSIGKLVSPLLVSSLAVVDL